MIRPFILGTIAVGSIGLLAGFAWQTGKIDDWRTPGLAQCEAFTKAGLQSPSSYKRISFVVVDTPVSKEIFAKSKGGSELDKAMADIADAPGIRGIALDYDAENGYGALIRGGTACYFPMSDIKNGEPSGDLDSLERMAESSADMGRLGFGKGNEQLCCLAPTFDVSSISYDQSGAVSDADVAATDPLADFGKQN